ncbi:MAG: phosphatidylserine/phosphatidylglycerophosphate/cardiolipin synthase family protein [Spirochaetia bacterium]|jgi:cardiolipin synthase|nr:phosphatidylserine/phosphatidylglycerophosphate/cardiolipin synthase family protein [Spirochaetia bacterium]
MKFKAKYLLIILTVLALSSCATTGREIKVKASSKPEALQLLQNQTGKSPVWSSYPVFDFNGDEVRNRMLSLIENARDYIMINSYLLMYDEYGSIILEAINKKYKEGVNVYIIADSSNYLVPGESGFSFLKENLIPFVEYNPIRPYKLLFGRSVIYRDHRKFWVVDGKYVYIGGCNIINSSLTPADQGGNIDGMVLVESQKTAEILIEAFVRTWNNASDLILDSKMFRIPDQKIFETKAILINQEINGNNEKITDMLSGFFSAARKEVWIIQPYTFVNSNIIKAVKKMVKKGVDVNIILSKDSTSSKYYYASFYGIKDLLEAGAVVWLYSPPARSSPLHFKAFFIDNEGVSIGSANFNQRSFRYSDEANIIFNDPVSFREIAKSLYIIKKSCRKVYMGEAKTYRTPLYRIWNKLMQIAG